MITDQSAQLDLRLSNSKQADTAVLLPGAALKREKVYISGINISANGRKSLYIYKVVWIYQGY